MAGKRIVITGATGNVGTSVLQALGQDPEIAEIAGVARRPPDTGVPWPKVAWHQADVSIDDLRPLFAEADAVVHVAWLFQPTHDPVATWTANVIGSKRVFESAASAGVPALVYSSSVGAYSPGSGRDPVDENWPTDGWPGAAYTREKAYVERLLDTVEARHRGLRVARVRPGFIFKREAASQQRRLFAGPLIPQRLVRPELIPVVPDISELRMQVIHTSDVAEAVRRIVLGDARGPFNLATEPVVDPALLARCLGARLIPLPARVARSGLALAWCGHLVPASPGLFDAVLRLPVMDTSRARRELGWAPRVSAPDAILEAVKGMEARTGAATAPLAPDDPGSRAREISTGIGQRP